jgi:hypothetical protein
MLKCHDPDPVGMHAIHDQIRKSVESIASGAISMLRPPQWRFDHLFNSFFQFKDEIGGCLGTTLRIPEFSFACVRRCFGQDLKLSCCHSHPQ